MDGMNYLQFYNYPSTMNCGVRYLRGFQPFLKDTEYYRNIQRDIREAESGEKTPKSKLSYSPGLLIAVLTDKENEVWKEDLTEHNWKETDVFRNPAHAPWSNLHLWTRVTDLSVEKAKELAEQAAKAAEDEKKMLDKQSKKEYNKARMAVLDDIDYDDEEEDDDYEGN